VTSSSSRASTSKCCAADATDSPSRGSLDLAASATPAEKRFPGQDLAPYIKAPVYVDYGTNLKIGRSTFINRYCVILDTPVDKVEIGDRCLIGPNFSIYAVSHPKGTFLASAFSTRISTSARL
jgi:acetyltransferase-like isoleucine patch superfamily enzyme